MTTYTSMDDAEIARLRADCVAARAANVESKRQRDVAVSALNEIRSYLADHVFIVTKYIGSAKAQQAPEAGREVLGALAKAEAALLDFMCTRTTHGEANFDLNLGETTKKVGEALDAIQALGIRGAK